MDDSRIFIAGAKGQLGTALRQQYPGAASADIDELDITNRQSVESFDWSRFDILLNAAAYTNVDGAETEEGKKIARQVNDEAVGYLVEIARKYSLTLVHISTAYVFDGMKTSYAEDAAVSPLGEYAKSKAAGDKKVAELSKHYIIRTDSVIGDGKNFVRTMLGLGKQGIDPTVVADQVMRPTFTSELVRGIGFLLEKPADYGLYNLTNKGEPISWANFTRAIFKEANIPQKVIDTTFKDYSSSKPGVAPRPLHSVLYLAKIENTGFTPHDWRLDLAGHIKKELKK